MKGVITFLLIICSVGFSLPAFGGQFYGGKGYLHTNAASLLPAGALDMSFYARGYTLDVPGEDWNLSNGTSAFSAAFGFNRKIELCFSQILYQDLNATRRSGINSETQVLIPGDAYLRIKYGGWSIGRNLIMSLMPALRYRVGRFHDIHLEPYESEAIEFEIMGLWSYYWKPLYPDEDNSLHINISYLHHNLLYPFLFL